MRSANKHLLQEAAQWLVLGAVIVGCIYYFQDIKRLVLSPEANMALETLTRPEPEDQEKPRFSGQVRVKADRRGHFVLNGAVNGRRATFMADTGASIVFLTYESARRLGLSPGKLDFNLGVSTANGSSKVAPIVLPRVRISSITLRNVRAAVAEKGALEVNLLGMSFLGRLKSFNMRGNELILVQ